MTPEIRLHNVTAIARRVQHVEVSEPFDVTEFDIYCGEQIALTVILFSENRVALHVRDNQPDGAPPPPPAAGDAVPVPGDDAGDLSAEAP